MKKLILLACLMLCVTVLGARILNVSTIEDSTSYLRIQDAVNDAADGDSIFVQPGYYRGFVIIDSLSSVINRSLTIKGYLNENTILAGCFKVSNCSFFLSNFTVQDTLTRTGIYCENSTINLDSVIVRRCHRGFYAENSNVKICNSEFYDNHNTSHNYGGGGMKLCNTITRIENTKINHNTSYLEGGGICNFRGDLKISDCEINNNKCFYQGYVSSGEGGGIFNCGYLKISDCEINNNESLYGGGIITVYSSNFDFGYPNLNENYIDNTEISNNVAYSLGGGIHSLDSLKISNSYLINNQAEKGGAIYNESRNLRIYNSLLTTNNALQGDCIYFCDDSDSSLIQNCTIKDNGGLFQFSGSSDLFIVNSIIWNNNLSTVDNDYTTIQYSDIGNFNNIDDFLIPELCNWNENPLLDGNYYLSSTSPCIDAGTSSYTWNGETYNILKDDYFGHAPDIGCYESNFVSVKDKLGNIVNNSIQLINYPNPFNPSTTISFNLFEAGNVELIIFNVRGQRVKTFKIEMNPGENQIYWNGKNNLGENVASGIYFYKIKSGRYTVTKKMILMK